MMPAGHRAGAPPKWATTSGGHPPWERWPGLCWDACSRCLSAHREIVRRHRLVEGAGPSRFRLANYDLAGGRNLRFVLPSPHPERGVIAPHGAHSPPAPFSRTRAESLCASIPATLPRCSEEGRMRDPHDPIVENLTVQIVSLQAQLAWADASILHLVQAVELLDRSVHQFEATHPAMISDQVHQLLQQIRQSRPGPPPVLPPPSPPQPPPRRRH